MAEVCLFEICGQILFRGIATAVIYTIDKQIVQRRDVLVRYGRQVQKTLDLPDCICVFTAEDPGMADDDIRLAGMFLSFSLFFACLVTFGRVSSRGTIWDPYVLGFGVVNPVCTFILVWLMLILAKRRRLRGDMRYRTLEEDMNSVWTCM
ncbi:hypothetical protein GGS26DRAFT_595896 [Hypomontagnella submonticulosa]|nr:hypothetical protein GGS26DRAFT_595896 [Hypomontagnella submonticulosa]